MQFPVVTNWHSSISSLSLGSLDPGERALDVLRELKEPDVLGRDVVPDDSDSEQVPGLAVSDRGITFLGISTL